MGDGVTFTKEPGGGCVELREGDRHFTFTAGFKHCTRAGLDISPECPTRIRDMLILAITEGWVTPVAYMPEREHTWLSMEG